MGWIAWEPVRSRLRPRESVPANGRPADQTPWPGWVLQPSGSAAKASTKTGGSRGPRRGKGGAMGREPLPGNTGGDLGLREPVHETTTDSRTGENEGGDNS